MWLIAPLFLLLLSVVLCAATVLCSVLEDFNVYRTFSMLRKSSGHCLSAAVDSAIKGWCENVDRIAAKQRRWLHYANLSFIGASAVTAVLLATLALMHG